MPEKRFFLKLGGAFLLGLLTFLVSIFLLILFFPLISSFITSIFPWAVGSALVIISFFILWAIVYSITGIGVAIYYLFKPMKIKKKGKYDIEKAKEAGRRQKGKS